MLSPPGLGGAGVMTPRKYIKQLQAIAATLNKYLVSLSAGISKALKVLTDAIDDALSTYGKAEYSRIYSFLTEDTMLARLKTCVAKLNAAIAQQFSTTQGLPEDLHSACETLKHLTCDLPEHQTKLIHQFRKLARDSGADSAAADGVLPEAEALVREVIAQTYGVFWSKPTFTSELEQLLSQSSRPELTPDSHSYALFIASTLSWLQMSENQNDPGSDEPEEADPFFMPVFRPEDDQGGDLFVALSGGSFSGQRPVMTPRGGTSNLGIVLSTPRGEQSAGATPSPSSSRPNGLLGTRPMGSGRLVTPGSRSILDGAASRSPLDGSGGGLKARFRRSSSGPAAPPEQSATAALAATLGRSPSAPRRPVVPPINLNAAASPQPDAAPAPAAEQQEATPEPSRPSQASMQRPQTPRDGEKTERFVKFLEGVGPDKNMFRESMRLDFEACKRLSEFLRRNRIKALSLSHNHVGDEAVCVLAEALAENTSLTALDLPSNDITDKGAIALADALKANTTLVNLNLHENQIGDRGAAALARILISNGTISSLNLSANKIGNDGAKALTAAVGCNTTIKSIKMHPGNLVGDKEYKELSKAVRRNSKFSIKSLLGMSS